LEWLPCVELGPEDAAQSVVWLHGLGASGHDFEDVVPLLDAPDVRFVFPHAPRRPVTINGGLIMPAWYDLEELGFGNLSGNQRHIRESAELVEALLSREVERGVSSDRTLLVGFSQGGAIALHVGRRHARRLAGIVVLSGYELLPETREAEVSAANRATPVLFGHGTYDPVVPRDRGHAAYRAVLADGAAAEWTEYPMEHSLCLEEIERLRDWMAARLAPPA
jgi:phospholipase/carboxylesterase